jgi:hypothetical protein
MSSDTLDGSLIAVMPDFLPLAVTPRSASLSELASQIQQRAQYISFFKPSTPKYFFDDPTLL